MAKQEGVGDEKGEEGDQAECSEMSRNSPGYIHLWNVTVC